MPLQVNHSRRFACRQQHADRSTLVVLKPQSTTLGSTLLSTQM